MKKALISPTLAVKDPIYLYKTLYKEGKNL